MERISPPTSQNEKKSRAVMSTKTALLGVRSKLFPTDGMLHIFARWSSLQWSRFKPYMFHNDSMLGSSFRAVFLILINLLFIWKIKAGILCRIQYKSLLEGVEVWFVFVFESRKLPAPATPTGNVLTTRRGCKNRFLGHYLRWLVNVVADGITCRDQQLITCDECALAWCIIVHAQ